MVKVIFGGCGVLVDCVIVVFGVDECMLVMICYDFNGLFVVKVVLWVVEIVFVCCVV